jgi:hypothetical protein
MDELDHGVGTAPTHRDTGATVTIVVDDIFPPERLNFQPVSAPAKRSNPCLENTTRRSTGEIG